MTRQELIQSFTEDYNEILAEVTQQGKHCEIYGLQNMAEGWNIKPFHGKPLHVKDMSSEELATVCVMVDDMRRELEDFYYKLDALYTAKEKLENQHHYECDDDEEE